VWRGEHTGLLESKDAVLPLSRRSRRSRRRGG